jgi:hypothetical protein
MSVIDASNTTIFKDSSILFSKVKRFLSSYGAANLIDEGEFPTYVKEILKDLGIGVYKENDAILKVKNYKAKLPKNFEVLYAAYKCTPTFNVKDTIHPQSTVSVFNDVTWELLEGGDKCQIDCQRQPGNILEKITVRQYVQEKTITGNFTNPILLRLSPNVKKNKCAEDCENILASSPYEITLDDGFIITNFNEDNIYLKFYEFPLDENGIPLIPGIDEVEKTIEWYIIYQLLLKWYINGEVADIQGRMQYAENQYLAAYANAKYTLKLPSFASMINVLRRQRSTNLLMLMSQQG